MSIFHFLSFCFHSWWSLVPYGKNMWQPFVRDISRRTATYSSHLYIFSHTFVFFTNQDLLPYILSCSRQSYLCLCQVSCYLVLKLDTGCPRLYKLVVCCRSFLSQQLAVLLLIRSHADLVFPMTCKVLALSLQLPSRNVLPTMVFLGI